MRFFCLFILAAVISAAEFSLSGWEYEKEVLISPGNLNPHPSFLAAAADDKGAVVFFRFAGGLYAGRFSPPQINGVYLAAFDQYAPVIKEDKNIFFLLKNRGRAAVYRLEENLTAVKLAEWDSSGPFLPEFHVPGLLAAEQVFRNEKYGMVFFRTDGSKSNEIFFSSDQVKGAFFPQITGTGQNLQVWCILREYSSGKNELADSIYMAQGNPLAITPADFKKIASEGYINYPPRLLEYSGKTILLFPSRRRAVFQISLFVPETHRETVISPRFLDAVEPLFIRQKKMQIFFTGLRSGESFLYSVQIDPDTVPPGEIEDLSAVRASGGKFQTAAVSSAGPYLFFTLKNRHKIYFTAPDHSASAPLVRKKIITDRKRQLLYPQFFWETPPDPSGIAGYASLIDQNPSSVPAIINIDRDERFISAQYYNPGGYFLHIRSVDTLGNASQPVHIAFRVDEYVSRIAGLKPSGRAPLRPAETTVPREAATRYTEYIRQAQIHFRQGNMAAAKRFINLASLIIPEAPAHIILALCIYRRENTFFRKNYLPVSIFLFSALWLFLLFYNLQLHRRKV
ncbi:MAG: hypothetical protein A2096_13240 [Spirochaetes bacterium GWF1_41_5]|nr:MAG: hypothetical protein A2096_13240 [Spirochaetes bacterium GWF1_41_5]HBE04312.1 hypothetical protein [Spirochaetia bacterium]